MQPCEFVAYITTVACAISKCCSNDEIEILAAAFSQLGDTLATILVQKQFSSKDAGE